MKEAVKGEAVSTNQSSGMSKKEKNHAFSGSKKDKPSPPSSPYTLLDSLSEILGEASPKLLCCLHAFLKGLKKQL